MKLSNVIIAAIFLVFISLFSLNFEELTGYVTASSKVPSFNVVQDSIKSGEKITIKAKINGYCIDPEFELVRENGLYVEDFVYLPNVDDCVGRVSCKANKYCAGDLEGDAINWEYQTPSNLDGGYKVVMKYFEKPGQKSYDAPFVEDNFFAS